MCLPISVDPHKGDCLYAGVREKQFGFLPAACDQIDHSLWKTGLVIEQLQNPHGRQRRVGRGLQNHGVSGYNRQRNNPSPGDHGREIEGDDSGHNAQGHPVSSGVKAGCNLQGSGALGDERLQRRPASVGSMAFRMSPRASERFFAQFLGAQHAQLFQMVHQNVAPFEHHLRPLADGSLRPCREGRCRGSNRFLHFLHSTAGDLRNDLPRAGVTDRHPSFRLGIFPFTIDTELLSEHM